MASASESSGDSKNGLAVQTQSQASARRPSFPRTKTIQGIEAQVEREDHKKHSEDNDVRMRSMLTKECRLGRLKQYEFFLFDSPDESDALKVLVYAAKDKETGQTVVQRKIPLSSIITVKDLGDDEKGRRFRFAIENGVKTLNVFSDSLDVKRQWTQQIMQAVARHRGIETKPILPVSSSVDSIGDDRRKSAVLDEDHLRSIGYSEVAIASLQKKKAEKERQRKERQLLKAGIDPKEEERKRAEAERQWREEQRLKLEEEERAKKEEERARQEAQQAKEREREQQLEQQRIEAERREREEADRRAREAQENTAATKIQAFHRGRTTRKEYEKEKRLAAAQRAEEEQRKHKAAAAIQSVQRGRLARKQTEAELFLYRGGVLLKHHRFGGSKERLVRMSRNGTLSWSDPAVGKKRRGSLVGTSLTEAERDEAKEKGVIELRDVTKIARGHFTDIMKKQQKVAPALVFSVLTEKRTVDLQCATAEDREKWVTSLETVCAKLRAETRR